MEDQIVQDFLIKSPFCGPMAAFYKKDAFRFCRDYAVVCEDEIAQSFWMLKMWLNNYEEKPQKTVWVSKGTNTARYVIAEELWKQKQVAVTAPRVCELIPDIQQLVALGSGQLTLGDYRWIGQSLKEKIYSKAKTMGPYYDIKKFTERTPKLELVSSIPRGKIIKKKVKVRIPFFVDINKTVTVAGRFLRRTKVGRELLTFVRNFYKVARKVALNRRLDDGFIFSFSHSKFCEEYGYKKSQVNRLINLAAGLGLITKITPVEGKGIGEYWHKKFSVGTLQFKLTKIDPALVEGRWKTWCDSGIKLHDLTLGKIKCVLGVDINTHPEAKDLELRKKIKAAMVEAEEERACEEKKKQLKLKAITEDPLKIGHLGKRYDYDIKRKYSTKEAKMLLADIIEDHNENAMTKWPDIKTLELGTKISYRLKEKGRYTKYRTGYLTEDNKELLIPEYCYYNARKAARAVISELWQQGLIGIVTKADITGYTYDWTTDGFLSYLVMKTGKHRGPRSTRIEDRKERAAFLFDLVDDMFIDLY